MPQESSEYDCFVVIDFTMCLIGVMVDFFVYSSVILIPLLLLFFFVMAHLLNISDLVNYEAHMFLLLTYFTSFLCFFVNLDCGRLRLGNLVKI